MELILVITHDLVGKNILITGSARRIGRHLALALAQAGANIIIHHSHSILEAEEAIKEIQALGVKGLALSADFNDLSQVQSLIARASSFGTLYGLINNASIFSPLTFSRTTLVDWQTHLNINLTAPFLLSQAFANSLPPEDSGRIINILDWRALRPGKDHFPYTISKAGLASLTNAMAIALAPRISVNGLALGAILPPEDDVNLAAIIKPVPAGRWAELNEVSQVVHFLLTGPEYITGEIIHLDGGRHLV